MTRLEYHARRRKKFAEMKKNRVDAAYEYYCSLSDEDKQIAESTFACKLAKHLCISLGVARSTTSNLIAEYHIEFCKYKTSNPSFGFTGKTHSDEARAAIRKSVIERNKARVIMCKEQGLNYRHYKQDADKSIEVADFSNARAKSIDSEKIII